MAMEIGDARKGTGLAGAMAAEIKALDKRFQVDRDKGWVLCDALAKAIVEYLTDNVELANTSPPTSGGIE